jgi:hypothetical protein
MAAATATAVNSPSPAVPNPMDGMTTFSVSSGSTL